MLAAKFLKINHISVFRNILAVSLVKSKLKVGSDCLDSNKARCFGRFNRFSMLLRHKKANLRGKHDLFGLSVPLQIGSDVPLSTQPLADLLVKEGQNFPHYAAPAPTVQQQHCPR